jgi:phenylpyruvate tautomerase PptA (4-oxalocrotonate tautomerase family)
MPVISVTLLPGYSAEAEARLVGRVALAARSVVAAAAAGTTVFVNHAATYQRDGKVFTSGGAELPEASRQARAFLDCMEQRDLEGAKRLLAPGFEMHFPAAAPMQRLEELVAHACGRYRHVSKTYTRFDESWDDACTVVYCFGTLQGVERPGAAFAGRHHARLNRGQQAQRRAIELRPARPSTHPESRHPWPATRPGAS